MLHGSPQGSEVFDFIGVVVCQINVCDGCLRWLCDRRTDGLKMFCKQHRRSADAEDIGGSDAFCTIGWMTTDQSVCDILYQVCNAGSILDDWFCFLFDVNIVILRSIDNAGLPAILFVDVGRNRKCKVSEVEDRGFAFSFVNTAWLRVFQIVVCDDLDGLEASVVLNQRGAVCDRSGDVNDNPEFVIRMENWCDGLHLLGAITVIDGVWFAGNQFDGVVITVVIFKDGRFDMAVPEVESSSETAGRPFQGFLRNVGAPGQVLWSRFAGSVVMPSVW